MIYSKASNYIKAFFGQGDARTLIVKKNVALSFLFKGGSILISLVLVPLTINYISPIQYGIWLTLSSLIGWFGFFDIGLGNGLRNKLSEAISKGDTFLAKSYVSTTYAFMCIISLCLLVTFFIANFFLDWSKILNAPSSMVSELSVVALVFFLLFSIQFVVQLINIVCFANQNTMMTSLIGFLGSLLGLTIIYILTRTVEGRLLYLCLAIGVTPILIYIIFSLVLFNTTYKEFAPNFRFAKAKYVKDIIGLGFKFFIIQLGLIFFYNADNIIIAQTMGPTGVTPYNIAYKYFTVITMISGIIMTPLWPAFTQANIKGDTVWIKKMIKKMQKICLFVFLLSMVMLVVSPIVYNLWIGDKVHIPWMLSLVLAIYTSLNTYRTVYCYYANAVGKINVQLIIVLTAGVLNIPLGIFLGKLYGAVGVILATTILCFICGIIEIIQYRKLISYTAKGIWNK
ncbi:oligosaccharide flippase family protein [Pedobacter sp. MC2016-05]|uniref:lipopolysaccharide biosynthesis protein n=1 Tax=Pedobacter sp. MC2016-05 TaxID=2994474 RepID=UPI00224671D5|nr:oligosaccharide flippase family protein [Pedobacter sp. MC2016-05]MCX2473181.1 oligosaccharide flippase family protein [Pedobacter sp. MC2016-05]